MRDARIENHEEIVLLQPLSEEARWWFDDHVDEEAHWVGDTVVAERQYAADLIVEMKEAGLKLLDWI